METRGRNIYKKNKRKRYTNDKRIRKMRDMVFKRKSRGIKRLQEETRGRKNTKKYKKNHMKKYTNNKRITKMRDMVYKRKSRGIKRP